VGIDFGREFGWGLEMVLSATLKISSQIHKLNIKISRNIYYSTHVQTIPSFRVVKFEPIFQTFFYSVFRVIGLRNRFKN